MARFLRSQPSSKLRPPVVVSPAVVFRSVQVYLAVLNQQAQQNTGRRGSHYSLRPPAAVNPAVVFAAVRVLLASQTPAQTRARWVKPKLQPPTVVAAAVVFRAVKIVLADQRTALRARRVRSRLQPPAVVSTTQQQPTADQLRLRTTITRRPFRPARYGLAAPAVIAPAPVLAEQQTVRRALARAQSLAFRRVRSALRPPATLAAPAVTFIAPALRAALTRRPAQAGKALSKLRAPVVVAAAVVFPPVRARLVKTPRQAIKTRSFYTPIPPFAVTLTLDQTKLRAKFAPQYKRPQTQSVIRRPVVVARPVLRDQLRLRTTLAPHAKQGRVPHYILRKPAVIDARITTRFFDVPSPSGPPFDAGTPSAGQFDPGSPSGGVYDQPTPAQSRV